MALGKTNQKELDDNASAEFIAGSLSPIEFLRTFSYREVLTAITLSFCCVAGITIIEYYQDERFIHHWYRTIWFIGVTLIFLASHVYYRFEHGRSNNLVGRSIFDLLFLVCYYLIKSTYWSIIRQSNQFSFEADDLLGVIGIFLGVLILVFTFEFMVSLLKYMLKFFRCPVL